VSPVSVVHIESTAQFQCSGQLNPKAGYRQTTESTCDRKNIAHNDKQMHITH